jgi:hypothetical protein
MEIITKNIATFVSRANENTNIYTYKIHHISLLYRLLARNLQYMVININRKAMYS